MDELKSFLSADENDAFQKAAEEEKQKKEDATKKAAKHRPENIKLAKLYEDAYEYEEELASFEAELEVIDAHKIEDMVTALTQELPDKQRDYNKELQDILVATWAHKVETQKTHPQEQLEIIKNSTLSDVVEKLNTAFPQYEGDFSKELKASFTDRLKMLIEIKKDHIKEEIDELEIAGLKPSFVKRIFKQVNGL